MPSCHHPLRRPLSRCTCVPSHDKQLQDFDGATTVACDRFIPYLNENKKFFNAGPTSISKPGSLLEAVPEAPEDTSEEILVD